MRGATLATAALFLFSLSAHAQTCNKVVSFALADATGVHPFMGTGNWIGKWVAKNAKKHPDICFSQNPLPGQTNYLVVLSQSAGYFTGFDPVVRTNTSTSTSPVSGTGTVTSNYGGMWNYSYNGTETTTTTTTTTENVPYTVTSNTIYAYAYRSDGANISRRYHVYTTRSGGDAYNTAGYNLGNALAAISARGRLIGAVVKDVETQPAYVSTVQQPIQSETRASPQDSAQPSLAVLPHPAAAAACKLYSETGVKQSISENADGKILILSDGSMWEVTEIDTTDSALWLPVDDVIVMRADNPAGCFLYTVIDASEHAEKVQAQYLGQR
jgi:hypothetical protein